MDRPSSCRFTPWVLACVCVAAYVTSSAGITAPDSHMHTLEPVVATGGHESKSLFARDDDPPVFHLACGEAHGVWLPPMAPVPGAPPAPPAAPVAAILGVPFAQPPVGRAGRWKPPRPSGCWKGSFNATLRPTQCVQWMHVSVMPLRAPMSEDCLRLNVFTPTVPSQSRDRTTSPPRRGLPIFFWIYGGDNTIGLSPQP